MPLGLLLLCLRCPLLGLVLLALCARGALSKKVRRRERSQEDAERAEREKEADARRKRVRHVKFEKEDRDALCKLARSRDDGTRLPLETTPAGLRETAMDGTPRSAKAAGMQLRKLTQTFYEQIMDPRFYGVTEAVSSKTCK